MNSLESIVSNKLDMRNKELPNFFLPPQDLEKSMRELQHNYKQVSKS
jgi:hypothetical protein